jgi:polysaccharide biosynthesis/export protein
VFVVGNVKKPGAFRIEDASGMTVLKALAMAEGLAPFATKQAYIYRHGAEETVDLRKILDRKSPDILLAASDIFYIPDNRKARVTTNVLEKTVGFAASTASGILILSHP